MLGTADRLSRRASAGAGHAGTGRHPAPLDKVHIRDFVDSAVSDIEQADASDVVLVGHSMAGVSLPGIVDRVHARLDHVVFLSCVVPAHGESMASELAWTGTLCIVRQRDAPSIGMLFDPDSGQWTELPTLNQAKATRSAMVWIGFNHRRLFEDHGRIPPAEFEDRYYRQTVSAEHGETHTPEPA